jgi:polysaccharide biosynthesis/export protein
MELKTVFRQALTWIVVAMLGLLLAGCPGSGSLEKSGGQGEFQTTEGAKPIGGAAAASAQRIFAENASLNSTSAGKDYQIAALDVLDVSVFGVPDLTRTVQVSSSGVISLPLINQVKAAGKTQGQLEQEIARKLSANYLQAPQVSVFIKEYNSQRITVEGAVKKPGIYPVKGDLSLLQSIALAEGLTELADTSGVLVFRTVDNKRLAARFDIKQVRAGKIDDPMLKAGDVVMVDESSTRTMLRDVKSALPLTGLFQLLLL